jgi:hypothetical protein
MVYIFFCCIVVKIHTEFKGSLAVIAKKLFSEQIGIPLTNALKSVGYINIVLFLTIGKSDIYEHKSLGKSVIDFFRIFENRQE